MVKNLIKEIERHSTIVSTIEEFGLIKEERNFKKQAANGKYTSLKFKAWQIQNHIIYKTAKHKSEYHLNSKSKFIVLNIHNFNSLEWRNTHNEKMQLKPNTGLFLNNLKNTFTLCNSEMIQFVIIEYKEEYFKQSIFNASFQEYLTNTLNLNDRITFTINSKIESILTEVLYPKKGGLCQFMHLNNNVFDLLSIIINFSELTEDHKQKHAYHVQLEKVRKTIDHNLNIQYSIEVLSKIAGLNTSYLKKYFKEAYNITLFEYAKKKRIKYAKNLLIKGNLPVSAIAEKIGYQQASHFSFAFKKSTGFTPIQYRKTQ